MTSKFEIGDIVKFKDKSNICPDLLHKVENIYKIIKIEDSKVVLGRNFALDINANLADIEGVKMDGVEDRFIYYDPVIMASFVLPGQKSPTIKKDYTYYLDANAYFPHNKTMRDFIKENEFTEVHQLQHFLRENYRTDDLKINV